MNKCEQNFLTNEIKYYIKAIRSFSNCIIVFICQQSEYEKPFLF